MPYKNWTVANLGLEQGPHESRQNELTIIFDSQEFSEFRELMEDTFKREEGELRLELPKNWTLFWKLKDGESRVLLAHPEQTVWVATIALDKAHGDALVAALSALQPGNSVALGQLAPVSGVSNLEVKIAFKG